MHAAAVFELPEVAEWVSHFLPPLHQAAAASKLLCEAVAARTPSLWNHLRCLECRLEPSFAPRVLGRQRLLQLSLHRGLVAASKLCKELCPHGNCGSKPCKIQVLPSSRSSIYFEDVDWEDLAMRKLTAGSLETLVDVAAGLPTTVVVHTRFEGDEGYGFTACHDTHVLIPVASRTFEFAYTTEMEEEL
eukprot:TRINITY_DN41720_c0_g1_i1.p1 TRINITY_DN41720_c0_g1~~TRINITY_DN41720_c0_g1_i1.p1  ORF type:complete len:189 (-),score=32.88 TRINITY_DN41720_c0_g1_i1:78-644(-)